MEELKRKLAEIVTATKYWQDLSSKEWAIYLMVAHYDKIDWSYCEKMAAEKQVSDLLQEIKKEAQNLRWKLLIMLKAYQ